MIKGKEYEGKCTFMFDKTADDKYNDTDAQGNKTGGFMSIYMKLLNDDLQGLAAFWDCAASNYGRNKPSVPDIQEALQEFVDDEEADVDGLFSDAFKAIHNSGFYKKKARKFWDQAEQMVEAEQSEEKKVQKEKAVATMFETRDRLLA
ncbi:tail assembly chaperone [Planococcus sp. SIMBA_143]